MNTHRQLAGRAVAGLLLIVMVAACSRILGPHLHVDVDNTDGPREVTVTVVWTGPGVTAGEDVTPIPARQGSGWRLPLGSSWEVRVDGRHVIGSDDRPDLALPSRGPGQDVAVTIRIRPDGTVRLLEACLDEDRVDGRCVAP